MNDRKPSEENADRKSAEIFRGFSARKQKIQCNIPQAERLRFGKDQFRRSLTSRSVIWQISAISAAVCPEQIIETHVLLFSNQTVDLSGNQPVHPPGSRFADLSGNQLARLSGNRPVRLFESRCFPHFASGIDSPGALFPVLRIPFFFSSALNCTNVS